MVLIEDLKKQLGKAGSYVDYSLARATFYLSKLYDFSFVICFSIENQPAHTMKSIISLFILFLSLCGLFACESPERRTPLGRGNL